MTRTPTATNMKWVRHRCTSFYRSVLYCASEVLHFFLIIEDKTFISKKMTTYSVWWSARNLQYP